MSMLRFGTIGANVVRNNNRFFTKSAIRNSGVEHGEPHRTNPFSVAGLLKHKELLPLVAIVTAGLGALVGYSLYFVNSRFDVSFRKKQPYESMDLLNPPVGKMKNTVDYRTYTPNSELAQLYKDMAVEEVKLRGRKAE